MIRGFLLVGVLSIFLSACESWNLGDNWKLGYWKRVDPTAENPAKWVYVRNSDRRDQVSIGAPPVPLPIPEPQVAPEPAPDPVSAPASSPQPAASTSGGQGGEPKVITCTVC